MKLPFKFGAKGAIAIALSLCAIFGLFQIITAFRYEHRHDQRLRRELRQRTTDMSKKLGERVHLMQRVVDTVIQKIKKQRPQTDKQFRKILRNEIDHYRSLTGLTIAYRPEMSPHRGDLCAPYITQTPAGLNYRRVEETYDYTEGGHDWFDVAIENGEHTTDPYWGESGQNWMVTHSRSFTLPGPDGEPRIAGVVAADYTLKQLWNFLKPGQVSADGYAVLMDSQGHYLAHPNVALIAEGRKAQDIVREVAPNHIAGFARALETGRSFLFPLHNIVTQHRSVGMLMAVPNTQWRLCQVVVDQNWGDKRNQKLRHFIHMTLTGVIIVWLAALLVAWSHPITSFRWNITVILISIGALTGMAAIWWLHSAFGQYRPTYHKNIIGLNSSIQESIKKEQQYVEQQHRPTPVISPVGILVRSLRKTDSDEFNVHGIIWQRLPLDRPEGVTRGVFFPDADKSTFKEQYYYTSEGYEVAGWKFSATLRQRFDNKRYPFDRINLRIRMRKKGLKRSVMLVPDLGAYRIGLPSATPYIADNTSLPGWTIESTFFTMSSHTYDMDFGLHETHPMDDMARSCSLNIIVRRKWLRSLIVVLIPIFIILGISYAAIRMITQKEHLVETYGFRPVRMVLLGATFCLFLILVSAGLRKQMVSDHVFYVEWLFFMLYLLVGINCWIGTTIAAGRGKLAEHDGRRVKLFYWPIVLTVIYAITFGMFV